MFAFAAAISACSRFSSLKILGLPGLSRRHSELGQPASNYRRCLLPPCNSSHQSLFAAKRMCLHFLILSSIYQVRVRSPTANKSDWKRLTSLWSLMVLNNFESSAKSLNTIYLVTQSGRSLVKTTKSNGSRTDPWGTPLVTSHQLEVASPKTTRYLRLDKNLWIQESKSPHMPYAICFEY